MVSVARGPTEATLSGVYVEEVAWHTDYALIQRRPEEGVAFI